jgi:hypothetical protein
MARGRKTGGRRKGSINKRTAENMALVNQATSAGISPLEVMLQAMRAAWERQDHPSAVKYAADAAPYMHPKLSNIQHQGDANNPLGFVIATGVPSATDDTDDRPQAH